MIHLHHQWNSGHHHLGWYPPHPQSSQDHRPGAGGCRVLHTLLLILCSECRCSFLILSLRVRHLYFKFNLFFVLRVCGKIFLDGRIGWLFFPTCVTTCLLSCKCSKRKACVSCLVRSRSSELTAHYIYDLATGLVGSCRSYLSGRRRSLCQIEKGYKCYCHTSVCQCHCTTALK